ncbi:hypothetical protein D9V32_14045 [Mycetocola tolaasinivorans]|uniref:Uncharacterized protein n=1 Tax=Mycetocola tolaasinivorans TaxID=76635 RepID=A0A3L7A0W1_9MICO|nr:hypothetical protein D9V32_14045 [Mycetocola tolaasinivorans]
MELARTLHSILTREEPPATAGPSEFETELITVAVEDLLATTTRAGITPTTVLAAIRGLTHTLTTPNATALAAVGEGDTTP